MNKTIVITGASAGIGRALAFEFARRGYHLGLTARRLNVLEAIRSEILADPHCAALRIELAIVDVADEATAAPGLRTLFEKLGGVDIVVANAGVNDFTRIGQGDFATESRVIRTNLIGAMATADAAVSHFLTRGGGHLVGISSLASLQPMVTKAAYCASKAGFSMYLNTARIELRDKGIVVTDILPGYVKTEMLDGVGEDDLPFAISTTQCASQMATLIERRVRRGIVPSFPWKLLRPLIGHLPQRFTHVHRVQRRAGG